VPFASALMRLEDPRIRKIGRQKVVSCVSMRVVSNALKQTPAEASFPNVSPRRSGG